MSWWAQIFFLLNNLLGTYITYRFMQVLLSTRRIKNRELIVLIIIYYVINNFTFFVIRNDFVVFLSNVVCVMTIIIVGFEGNLVKKLLSISLVLVLGVGIEETVWYFINWFYLANPLSVSLLSNLVLCVFVFFLEKIMTFKNKEVLPVGNSLMLTGIPFASIVLIFVLNIVGNQDEKALAMEMSIIVLINIFVFVLYAKMIEVYRKELERITLNQQVRMYEKQIGLMEEARLRTKAVRHDMKNHFLVLDKYIHEGDYYAAEQYLDEINGNLQVEKQYVYSGNNVVDSILNYYMEIAEQQGAKILLEVFIPDHLPINAFDLNVILGNLIQNAVEALAKCDEMKEIEVILRLQKNLLWIKVSNTFNGVLFKWGEKMLTSKGDRENHGIGIENIRNAVQKYDGKLQYKMSEKKMEAQVFLVLPETE